MDHNCLEIGDDLPEFGSGLALVEIGLAVNDRLVVSLNGSGHVGSLVWVGGIAKTLFIVSPLLLKGSVTLPRRDDRRRPGAPRRRPARSWAARRSPRQ